MSPFLSIAAVASPGTTMFSLGLVGEIFSSRAHIGLPGFDFAVCAAEKGPLQTDLGIEINIKHDLSRLEEADLVLALPAEGFRDTAPPAVLDALRAAHRRGAIVASHCVGTFVLAQTGLLDGKKAATHWRFRETFASRYPDVALESEALYVDEGGIVTGSGAAAGLDMCLHLLRREHGAVIANGIARDLVVAPHREGGQAQFITAPVPADTDDNRLTETLEWARGHLDLRLSIADLAEKAMMSRRTFMRRFKDATGTTPNAWLLAQRLNRAEELLETTGLSIEEVARHTGYQSAAFLREQFARRRGISPRSYRRAFQTVAE